MSPSGAEVIRQIKQQVQEVDPAEVSEHLGNGVTLVDVRESEEWDRGHIPGAVHVPRGYLESRIDGAVGEPRPPAPSSSTFASSSFAWPSAPTSGSRRWRP